jgi:SecD/SecF fusion protein
MKSFFWKIVLCVAPMILAGLVVAWAFQRYSQGLGGFKLGVDLVGGTILVYEVDPEKKPENFKLALLAERLKRRIDPADLYNVTIRPVPETRVEIILPTGGGSPERRALSAEEVERTKELISRVGSLRFVILANRRDDNEPIEAALRMYNTAATEKHHGDLRTARNEGKPPPPPEPVNAEGFDTPLGRYTYTWVEIGREMRKHMGLDNASETVAGRNLNWKTMEEARKKDGVAEIEGLLLYSRTIPAERAEQLPPPDRDKKIEYFVLTRDTEKGKEVTGEFLIRASEGIGRDGALAVHFGFNTEGANRFYDLTSKNKPEGDFRRRLAIVLDELIVSAPTLNDAIRDSGEISGSFTKDEVDKLVTILRAGALPATLRPQPVSETTIGATLGADTIRAGSLSVLLAFGAVLVFMLIYYRFAGVVACVALLANLLLTVAVMVLVKATFTLPGLAGLVLMLGMAVDANVLIYERLREERDRGASLVLAIRNAYDRAFPTIIDTHLSSIFTAVVLYVVGNDQLKGFGISLTLGLIISLFTSLYMTRVMFDLWMARGWLHKLSMLRFFTRPNIDFMAIRNYCFAATATVTILGGSLFIWRLDKGGLNIDFTGGTLYSGQLTRPVDLTTLRAALSEEAQKDRLEIAEGDVVEVPGSNGYSFRIKYKGESESRRIELPNPDTAPNVRERAMRLKDFSIQQTFATSPEFTEGDKSAFFTVLTSERAPEIVQAALTRLLEGATDDKGEEFSLRKLQMAFAEPRLNNDTKKQEVVLTFTDAKTREPAYASVSQVRRLLTREFSQPDTPKELAVQAQLFSLQGDKDFEQGERFSQMLLGVNPVEAGALKRSLERAQREFADRPQPERLENFDKVLAGETQTRAMYAILASWGAILLYLWFRFGNWTFGLAAVICLIHDLFFTLGIIAICHYISDTFFGRAVLLQDFKIDLQTVAALLTLVGYSVNDTIVVFDRIREVRGKNPELTPKMINDSVNQTLSRTLLASLTTWLVVIVLYIFGGEGVHLFAFVMVIGVIVGTYSSIYVASPLLLIFREGVRAGAIQRQPAPQSSPA